MTDEAEGIADFVDETAEGDEPARRRGFAGAPVGKGRLAIGDRPVEGADQLRRETLDGRIGQAAEAIGEELSRC